MARLFVKRDEADEIEGMPSSAVVGSMTLHTLALLFLGWGATRVTLPQVPEVYRVDLVAAPSKVTARPTPAAERARPAETDPKSRVPETQPAVTEKPRQQAPREEPQKTEKPEPNDDQLVAPAAAAPGADESAKVDQPVRLEGAIFPYPEYLENIIIQIKRHWRPPPAGRQLRAELAFTVLRDGSVVDVAWVQRSGSLAFDLEARGAIETAGRRKAFGPLPDAYPGDQLRVSFFFDPTRY